MNSTMLVANREFRHRVRSRGFLIQLILTPLIFLTIAFFVGFSGADAPEPAAEAPDEAIGYVDDAGIIQTVPDSAPGELLQSFSDVESAAAALERGEIAAYYVIPEDYRTSGEVLWVGAELPIVPPNTGWFEELLEMNVLANAGDDVEARLRRPFNAAELPVNPLEPDGGSAGADGLNWAPFIVALVVLIPLFTAGGYLFEGLVQEKSNRIMEILLVSLRPGSLLSGKMLGLGLMVLVQYAAWGLIALVMLLITDIGRIPTPSLTGVQLSAGDVLFIILYALGAYVLYAALMAGIGAVTASMENNRIWIFVVTLPMLFPIYLWNAIVSDPNGPLAVAFSMFPFSAPVAMLMRLTVTNVPLLQVGVSLALLFVTGLGTIWLMGRLFRAHTLLSGESLSPRRIWSALSG